MKDRELLDTLQAVELAEGIVIRLRVCGPLPRIGAYMIDFGIRIVLTFLVFVCLAMSGIFLGEKVSSGIGLLIWFMLDWFYPVLFEVSKWGGTPGKRMLGLRVVQENGSPVTFAQAVVRNFLRFVDSMPIFFYVVGIFSCLATKRFQRLGDLAAGVVVVYQVAIDHVALNSRTDDDVQLVPVALTADEVRAMISFRERSGMWSAARQSELADLAKELTGEQGSVGVERLQAMANWLQQKR